MSAARAAGDVAIFTLGLSGAVAGTMLTATVPGMVWSWIGSLFATSALWVAWGILRDGREADDTVTPESVAREPRTWTPADTREDSGRSNSFRPRDAWADDPDRTTRRES